MAKRKPPFSFKRDGPEVERLLNQGLSVKEIASIMGRTQQTIRNYLEYKGIKVVSSTTKSKKRKEVSCNQLLKSADDVVIGKQYYWTRYATIVVAKGIYNGAVKVWMPEKMVWGYAAPNQLQKI